MSDQLISRLRGANPVAPAHVSDDELRQRILASTPTWTSSAPIKTIRASTRRMHRWVISGAVIAAALAAVLTVSLSGRAPSVAQAFPALNGPLTLTPAALQQSLKIYGVSPNNDGIDIATGRAVTTPWGTGYILAGPDHRFVCLVAPGLSNTDWGASCAQTTLAITSGTVLTEYAYDPATHTARLLALLPTGATATTQASGGAVRQLSLPHGLLAIDITTRTQIEITINGHTTTDQLSPHDPTPTSSRPGGSATVTTMTASRPTSTTP